MTDKFRALVRNVLAKFVNVSQRTSSKTLKYVKSLSSTTYNDQKNNYETLKLTLNDDKNVQALKNSFITWKQSKYSELSNSVVNFSRIYDNITGRQSVRQAGVNLLEAEKHFATSQLIRRTNQQKLFGVQKKRAEVSKQVNVISRGDPAFMPLITKEHELAAEEDTLLKLHQESDLVERAAYEQFASLMRYLHAEERNYDMRMRQWALIGSLLLSFMSAFITWIRFRSPAIDSVEFQQTVKSIAKTESLVTNIDRLVSMFNSSAIDPVEFKQTMKRITQMESLVTHIDRVVSSLPNVTPTTLETVATTPSLPYADDKKTLVFFLVSFCLVVCLLVGRS